MKAMFHCVSVSCVFLCMIETSVFKQSLDKFGPHSVLYICEHLCARQKKKNKKRINFSQPFWDLCN